MGFSLRRVDAVVPWQRLGAGRAANLVMPRKVGRLQPRRLPESCRKHLCGHVRLVEAAQRSKAPMPRLADRFAIGFLVATVTIALGAWLAVLVVATPCPLILAVPVAIVSGLSRAAKQGILVKGGKALETMARIRALVVDKTGTLTAGRAKVVAVHAAPGFTADGVIWIAASLDQASKRIVAQTIVSEARSRGLDLSLPTDVDETAGEGICGQVIGRSVAVGGVRFVSTVAPDAAGERDGAHRKAAPGALLVAVAVDGQPAGQIVLADELRAGTEQLLGRLRRLGVERIVLATGDRREVAEAVTAGLAFDAVRADLTPDQKVMVVLAERKAGPVMMLGDGVNDAPALAAADVGVAMGANGTAAAAEAADAVLVLDQLDLICTVDRDRTASQVPSARKGLCRDWALHPRHGRRGDGLSVSGAGRAVAGSARRHSHPECAQGASRSAATAGIECARSSSSELPIMTRLVTTPSTGNQILTLGFRWSGCPKAHLSAPSRCAHHP